MKVYKCFLQNTKTGAEMGFLKTMTGWHSPI